MQDGQGLRLPVYSLVLSGIKKDRERNKEIYGKNKSKEMIEWEKKEIRSQIAQWKFDELMEYKESG